MHQAQDVEAACACAEDALVGTQAMIVTVVTLVTIVSNVTEFRSMNLT